MSLYFIQHSHFYVTELDDDVGGLGCADNRWVVSVCVACSSQSIPISDLCSSRPPFCTRFSQSAWCDVFLKSETRNTRSSGYVLCCLFCCSCCWHMLSGWISNFVYWLISDYYLYYLCLYFRTFLDDNDIS